MHAQLPHKERKVSLFKKIKRKILFLFRLNNRPVIRVYNGYGGPDKVLVFGHVLKLSPMDRKSYRNSWVVNTFSMLRLFMVSPYSFAEVSMEWEGATLNAKTEDDGFFRFELVPKNQPASGWHDVTVYLMEEKYRHQKIFGKGQFLIPYTSQLAFISDIDDTFLISHSSKLRKRLYVLFTKNARSRKPFEGVVNHYRQLAEPGHGDHIMNPFFYVSSSEWNLYQLIVEFSRENQLPAGVYLLNQIKKVSEILRTGQNKHSGKFTRIVRIIEMYPQLKFILMGDDTQQDPYIYLSIAEHFPGNVFAVYIRKVHKLNSGSVQDVINKIQSLNIYCCYFEHSSEAIEHSKNIGLITNHG
ncbi:MAG: phosphatase domain-containing protein [Ginsengibacter sp.]